MRSCDSRRWRVEGTLLGEWRGRSCDCDLGVGEPFAKPRRARLATPPGCASPSRSTLSASPGLWQTTLIEVRSRYQETTPGTGLPIAGHLRRLWSDAGRDELLADGRADWSYAHVSSPRRITVVPRTLPAHTVYAAPPAVHGDACAGASRAAQGLAGPRLALLPLPYDSTNTDVG